MFLIQQKCMGYQTISLKRKKPENYCKILSHNHIYNKSVRFKDLKRCIYSKNFDFHQSVNKQHLRSVGHTFPNTWLRQNVCSILPSVTLSISLLLYILHHCRIKFKIFPTQRGMDTSLMKRTILNLCVQFCGNFLSVRQYLNVSSILLV